jgi:hypothetical protein
MFCGAGFFYAAGNTGYKTAGLQTLKVYGGNGQYRAKKTGNIVGLIAW